MLHIIYNTFMVLCALLFYICEALIISHITQVCNHKWLFINRP
nr:unnamed protein product [Callosobruchus analis]